MFRKRQTFPILFLFLAVLACNTLFPNLPKNTVPDAGPDAGIEVARKDGECTDKRFKDAELAAYKALVEAQAQAEKKLKSDVDTIEARYQKNLKDLNASYQNGLNQCNQDAGCTSGAKGEYDQWVARAQISHDDGIYVAQGNAKAAIEAAQAAYNAAVEAARQKYCSPAYKATGQVADAKFSGVICSLEQPFTIDVTTPFVSYPMKFTPASSTSGSFTFQWAKGVITTTGSGQYTVEGSETDAPRISVSADSTGTVPVGSVDAGGSAVINLTPLGTSECQQP